MNAFYVGEWLVEPRLYRLSKGDSVLDIEPKIMHVLGRLARRPGELVERETLLDEVWSGTVVTGHVLNRSISQLRKALGDDTDEPRYIETIPKAGYRLIAPVRPVESDSDENDLNGAGFRTPATRSARPAPARRVEPRHLLAAAGGLLVVAVVSVLSLPEIRSFGSSPPIPSIRPITSFPGNELEPAFSPEGDRIAYVGTDSSDNRDLYVKLIGSGDPVRMTRSPDSERAPAWSPDGTRLAFLRIGTDRCHIVVMPALGGTERNIAECGVRTHPSLAWSVDGSGLIYSQREMVDVPFRLWQISLETMESRPLTNPPQFAFGDVDPAVSADGKTLAFVRGTSQWTKDIYRMSLDADGAPVDGVLTPVSSFKRDVQGLDWLDGNRLIFAANLSGQYGLWTITSAGSSLSPVPSAGGWTIRNPAFAPGSGRLSYEASSYDPDVWRMPLSLPLASGAAAAEDAAPDAAPAPFIQSSRWDFFPAYSPDGSSIAFISARSGSFELWISDADGSNPRQLTELDAAWIGTPFWSPGGQSLLFDANLEGQLELFVLDLTDHSVDRLTDSPDHDLASGWSADGRSVYFASEQTGSWQIWKMSIEDASARQLTQGGGYRAAESSDGSTVYFHRVYESGLWAVPASGGEETLVLDSVDPRTWRTWRLVDDDLYYIAHSDDAGSRLLTSNLPGGETTVLHRFDTMPGYAGLSVSPDMKWILFTYSEAAETDLMLVDDLSEAL